MIKLNLRLILIFLEISVIPLFLISYIALYQTRKIITTGTINQLEQIATFNKSKLKLVASQNREILENVSSGKLVSGGSAGSNNVKILNDVLSSDLNEQLSKGIGVKNLYIINSEGEVQASGDKNSNFDKSMFARVTSKIKGEEVYSDFILDLNRNLKLLAAKKVLGLGDKPMFLVVERDGVYILSLIEQSVTLGNSYEFILATHDDFGNSLYVTPSRFDQAGPMIKTTPGNDYNQSITIALSGREGTFEDSLDWRGKHVLSATAFVEDTGWGLVAKKDADETYLSVSKLSSLLTVIALVAVVIIVLISLSAATSIVAPINRLIKITSKISGGDLSQRTVVESKDELGLLELAFNDMASKLNHSYADLENKVAERTQELEVIRRNLEVANENLRELDKLKDEFVSVASHELRTPMTAIRGLVSMIFDGDYGPVNKNLEEPLADISKSTQRLIVLVNDILNVSRIETGKLKIALSTFDISPVISEMVEQLMPIAIEKGLSMQVLPGGLEVVQADKDKVKEILNNLIGNALKFTDNGKVEVSYSSDPDEVKVFVRDSGIGITKDDQIKLFGKFKQITSQQIGKPSGSGLGLYISRELARKMGGELWIEESNAGHGSVFAFSVPKANSQMAHLVASKNQK